LFVPVETDFNKEHLRQMDGEGGGPSDENVWNQTFKRERDASREELWSIYTDNLEYVSNTSKNCLTGSQGRPSSQWITGTTLGSGHRRFRFESGAIHADCMTNR